jgi:hypothetical protein
VVVGPLLIALNPSFSTVCCMDRQLIENPLTNWIISIRRFCSLNCLGGGGREYPESLMFFNDSEDF